MSSADPAPPRGAALAPARRLRLSPRAAALSVGCLLLALMAADVPLASLAHQSVNASGGSVPVWISAAFAVTGFAVAWRRPRNPIGWIMLAQAFCGAAAEDASYYAVADYRLHHGGLPLGWLALLVQPGWAPAIVLLGLVMLLFPDGRPPSPRLRWLLWAYAAVGALWIGGALVVTVGAIAGHQTRVDAGGNLLLLSRAGGSSSWWWELQNVFFPLLAACWLVSLAAQVLSYRRSSGERRQQLKWLVGGTAVAGASLWLDLGQPGDPRLAAVTAVVAIVGFFAIPVTMAVAILKYRLWDIDRIFSRTLAYAIVTGLLVGVYAGIVLLATRVVSITTPVAVAASTLAAAALFNPLRRRVQRLVDRRFNRARYDADRTVAAYSALLSDAVDLGTVCDGLTGAVQRSLEPAQLSLWLREP